MCIEEVKAWAFAGKHYTTELEAIEAAIDEIGRKVVKENATNPGVGLRLHADLPGLLNRHAELSFDPFDTAPAESPKGTHAGEPKGTQAELKNRINAAIGQMQRLGDPAKAWLTREGFDNLTDFASRTSRDKVAEWEAFFDKETAA